MLFELLKGLIKGLDGTAADEVHVESFCSMNFMLWIHGLHYEFHFRKM